MTYYASNSVLDSRDNLPFLVRVRDFILTGLVWALYIYFMRGFFVFLSDVVDWAVRGFGDTSAYSTFQYVPTFISYAEVIVSMEVVYVLWSLYNMVRFGGKDRRRFSPPVNLKELGEMHELNPKDIREWQQARVMVIHHAADGRVSGVDLRS